VPDASSAQNPLIRLLDLARRARDAESVDVLAFLAVNETHALIPYRQAALWFSAGGIKTLSGVVQTEANAPYVQWLNRVCKILHARGGGLCRISASELPAALTGEWSEWLPEFGLWLPFAGNVEHQNEGGLLFAGDHPWHDDELILLQEWGGTWHHAWCAHHEPVHWSRRNIVKWITGWLANRPELPYWKRPRLRLLAAIVVLMIFPVRLTVLAPGELVPTNPAAIRAPIDGVIGQFHVSPNQLVKAGQILFGFDEAALNARLDVATQVLSTAETEYRQFAQQALSDSKSKAQLAVLLGKIEEKRVEANYVREQLQRSRVVAPQDGIALFDDPTEWIGKPVQTGERVMRIAAPDEVEVEAWLPLGDAIPLKDGAEVSLYLASNPFSHLSARVRYMAHDAVPRPNAIYAYRVRAILEGHTDQRIGLKGTAKLYGDWVPFGYWMLRRPLATIRQTLGL
jgi:multidrug resistance efflux pump